MTAHISPWMNDELTMLQESLRGFYAKEMVPHEDRWQQQGHIDRDFWNKAGDFGILCASVPEEYGGMGGDFRHEAVIDRTIPRRGVFRVWQFGAQPDLRGLYS